MLGFIGFFFGFFHTVTPAAYYQIDYKSFYQLSEVNQKIDWTNPNVTLLEAAIFHYTNEQRILNKRKIFTHADDLNKAANYHSNSMVQYNFFSHTNNYDKKMKAFYQRMNFFGASFNGCGENIAYSEFDDSYTYLDVAKDLVEMWMNSPLHRENLLNGSYLELGCGVAIKKMTYWNRVYATQDFGAKRNSKL
ncbi:MAG: CAP domain-containing protein [Bacteroidota bacterium]